MKEKAIEVLALSDVKWPSNGVLQLESVTIAYSGMPADVHHHCQRGVTVVMSERAALAWRLTDSVFDLVSERIT